MSYKPTANFASSALVVKKSTTPAIVERKPDTILIRQWWSQSPFDLKKTLEVPVYSFHTGEFIGENVELDHSIFNVPLRRDIVHQVYQWRINYKKIRTDITRTKGTTAGSGAKPFRQKGTGRARQGNKRAPGRKKGGKAHGAKPRDYTYTLPKKVRLQALKIMLSAKLAEGKIRIVDNENIEAPKTRIVANLMKQFDPKSKILLVTSYTPDANFNIAQENIQKLEMAKPHNLNILKLLKCDKLVITKEGLDQLVQDLKDRTSFQYIIGPKFNREVSRSEIQRRVAFNVKPKEKMPEYDPSQPLNLKFKILQDYLKDYERHRSGEAEPASEDKKAK